MNIIKKRTIDKLGKRNGISEKERERERVRNLSNGISISEQTIDIYTLRYGMLE